VFDGPTTTVSLPISFSEKPGRYVVRVRNPITRQQTETGFEVGSVRTAANAKQENLILDGGFEDLKEVNTTVGYFRAWVRDGMDFGGGIFARVPTMFNQPTATKTFIIVEGQPGKQVHTGKYALRLSGQGFYLNAQPETHLKVQTGDVFEFSCYAKGNGRLGVHFGLSNDLKQPCGGAGPPNLLKVKGDSWTQVKHTIEVKKAGARYAFIRFAMDGELCVDDFFLRKVSGSRGAKETRK